MPPSIPNTLIGSGKHQSQTSEVLRNVCEGHRTMLITQQGKARAVLQDIASYKQTK